MLTALVTSIADHGSIVTLHVVNLETKLPEYVHFDRRPFGHLWEAEGGRIVGRTIEHDTSGDEPVVRFLD